MALPFNQKNGNNIIKSYQGMCFQRHYPVNDGRNECMFIIWALKAREYWCVYVQSKRWQCHEGARKSANTLRLMVQCTLASDAYKRNPQTKNTAQRKAIKISFPYAYIQYLWAGVTCPDRDKLLRAVVDVLHSI